mgnify:CR=1 FL=1
MADVTIRPLYEGWVFNETTGYYDNVLKYYDDDSVSSVIAYGADIANEKNASFQNTVDDLINVGIYNDEDNSISFYADNADNVPILDDIKEVPIESTSLIGEMKRKNIILENNNALLKQSNDLKYLEIKTNIEKMKMDVLFKLSDIKNSFNQTDLIRKNQSVQSKINTSLSQINEVISKNGNDNKESLDNLVTATENQEMTTTLSGVSVNLDNSTLVSAYDRNTEQLKKIAETAELKKEHLQFIKDGLSTLKDSKGNIIKPREVTAKSEAENHIKLNEQNTFNYQENIVDVVDSIPDIHEDENNSGLVSILSDILNVDSSVFDIEDKEKMNFVRGKDG